MPYNEAITLKVANREAFFAPLIVIVLMAVASVVLSSQPVLLTLISLVILGTGWSSVILYFSKLNDLELISVNVPDGQIQIKSHTESKIEGFLGGVQWCTSHIAVLRYKSEEGRLHYLVILPGQQLSNNYRRLKVWLRHDYGNDTGTGQVSKVAR